MNKCEDCNGTGWYGDNGPGIAGNNEYRKCECGGWLESRPTINKCPSCKSLNICFVAGTIVQHGDNADRARPVKHYYCRDCKIEWIEEFNKLRKRGAE
jgi:predicted Zn-ribbon and HTH transcriptional regulator